METGVKAGDASCGDAMAHASQNTAKTLNEAITIEFKNRDKFNLNGRRARVEDRDFKPRVAGSDLNFNCIALPDGRQR